MHNTSDSIGEPEPVVGEESNVFINSIAAMGIVACGALAFATCVVPARTSGASHSSQLKWERRQCEVDRAIAAQKAADDSGTFRSDAERPSSSTNSIE
jgi:hypothetical protein